MRTIKKSVKFTTAHVYKIDFASRSFTEVGTEEYPGGLGDRLVKYDCKRKYGDDIHVEIETAKVTYKMDTDTFFKYATPVIDENDDDTDDEE